MTRRRAIIGAAGRTVVASGTTSTANDWTLYSDGELLIENTTSTARAAGTINGWDSDNNASVTSVTIEGLINRVDGAQSVFQNLTNNTTLTIDKTFGTNVTTNKPLCLRYTSLYYNGTLAEWCASRDMMHQNANYTPYSGNQYDLYLNGTLLEGDITVSNLGTRGTFAKVANIDSVTIASGVTTITESAFNGSSITSVTIPNSVTSIGGNAFQGCTGLTSVTIPNSVTSIGQYAFYGCTGLTSVTIGDSVTSIEKYAFNGCTGLTSVTIPNSVTSIGQYAFYGCTHLTTLYFDGTIDEYLVSAAASAAYLHNNLTAIYIDGVQPTTVTIPSTVTEIKANTFRGMRSLTSVTIPNSVTSIGQYAFNGCTGLTSVTIPNSVTSIGQYAFCSCGSGLTITFDGCGDMTIGEYAFYQTNNTTLDFSTYVGSVPPTVTRINGSYTAIKVPSALYADWCAASGWSSYASKIVAV